MKNVFITGVLSKIGSAMARVFKSHDYYVYGVDLAEDFQGNCDRFLRFDIHEFVRDANYRIRFTQIFDELIPRLDVLINNAAVKRLDRLENIKLDDWQETLNVNLTGPMMLSKLFLSKLEKSRGCIINIGSIHQKLTKLGFVTYATSKSAMVGLTKALAVDLEGRVRVNAISPVGIEADMLRTVLGHEESALHELDEILPQDYPESVAKLALFITSESNGFIHGENFHLGGGIRSVLKDL